jgi:hypothetical protein
MKIQSNTLSFRFPKRNQNKIFSNINIETDLGGIKFYAPKFHELSIPLKLKALACESLTWVWEVI